MANNGNQGAYEMPPAAMRQDVYAPDIPQMVSKHFCHVCIVITVFCKIMHHKSQQEVYSLLSINIE